VTYQPESFARFGYDQRGLYDLKILLLRPLAYQFIRELGSTSSDNALNKRTSYAAYEAKYGRQPSLISARPRIMILTYTEWLGLAFDAPPLIALPELLR